MKLYKTLLLALPILGISHLAGATEIASVAIMNCSPQDLHVWCEVLDGTSFYKDAGRTHVFTFSRNVTQADQAIDIKNSQDDTLAMNCHKENNPLDYFTYRVKGDDEFVNTGGDFHYDHSYPGSLVYETLAK